MLWDGSHIGTLNEPPKRFKHGQDRYWRFRHRETDFECMVRMADHNLACVIDELKPVFGLTKTGTHSVRWVRTLYVLLRLPMPADAVEIVTVKKGELPKVKLPSLFPTLPPVRSPRGAHREEDPILKLQMQRLLAFREILGVTCSQNGAIRLLPDETPISLREPSLDPEHPGSIISNPLLLAWMKGSSISEAVRRLVKLPQEAIGTAKQTQRLFQLRGEIERVVRRVDRNAVWVIVPILERIMTHLQLCSALVE